MPTSLLNGLSPSIAVQPSGLNAYLNLAGDSVFVLSIISKAISHQGGGLILDALENVSKSCS